MERCEYEWVYTPAKWYALKRRGGALVCVAPHIELTVEIALAKITKRENPFAFIERAESEGVVEFERETALEFAGSSREAIHMMRRTSLYFKRPSDAIQFKMLYL
jgi:hypothetical protein